jgi:hypothetical protein
VLPETEETSIKKAPAAKAFGNLIIDQDKETTYANSILEQPCATAADQ